MAREIKFRAWSTLRNKKELIYLNEFTSEDLESCDNWKVMQYTGLKDKNDKEVYEDDIIHFSKYNQKHNETDQGIGIVKFDEFDYIYCLRLEDCKQIKPKPSGFFRGLGDLGSCEIIGNIYENPELMGGGK